MHEEDIDQLQSGVGLPTSSAEMDLMEKNMQVVNSVRQLAEAAQQRSSLLDGGNAARRAREGGDGDQKVTKKSRLDISLSVLEEEGCVLPGSSVVDAKKPNYTAVSQSEIEQRIATGDYTHEKTEEDIRQERAALVSQQFHQLQAVRRSLPIYKYRSELIDLVRKNQVVVVIGETGSGKTTQMLQYMFEGGLADVAANGDEESQQLSLLCTQPRRIAAISVAERVAKEMNQRCGGLVGYKVRFEDKTSASTRIAFVTDGIMLKEMMSDPMMSKIGVIMVDEAHERSLNSDILLGLLKAILRRNKQIRVIIASATIQADKFCNFFGGAPKFKIEGRTFPVELFYATDPVPDYVTAAAEAAMDVHLTKSLPGDILIFLPGQEDIENCAALLQEKSIALGSSIRELLILPIYASLPPNEQKKIYQQTPRNCRKVVIATNIAETSITIDGVVYVIDGGLCKQDFFNPKTMMDELAVIPTSRASAEQRRGRAGRTQPGECLRLFTKFMFEQMDPETTPEILRTTISSVVLQLKSLGVNNLITFDFLDAPSADAIQRSLDHLFLLGAIDKSGALTKTGFRMSEFPMDPSMSKMLLKSPTLGCARHMAMAAAMMSLDNSIFIPCRRQEDRKNMEYAREKLFALGNGDVFGYIRVFEEWLASSSSSRSREFEQANFLNSKSLMRAREVFDQILKTFDRWGIEYKKTSSEEALDNIGGKGIDVAAVTRSLIYGFFPNIAVLGIDGRSYTAVRPVSELSVKRKGSTFEKVAADIHPSSFLHRAGQAASISGATTDRAALESVPAALRERPSLVLYISLRLTKQDAPPFMIHVTSLADYLDDVMECTPKNYFNRSELIPGPKKR
ncbi:DEAD/DEAH box RNA helicase, putative [Bodo saltans]|nr:DEAD/DEAH box RNA helicase, putative [Bodo saltans]|eukprot:CUF41076.1 DEAD/DEAH box RNA helicase, putative [Bodo saltans]